ncbi:excalibur calcium-binding domain-containing protein, partial [Chitinophaga sp. GbtcB8]|uniref:excalibur calcium-binding domain-containing protein n=1 Tax=Chitinophaga sp. GbtcB8 TaxID=2824753 RepID=UPI0034CF603D
MHRVPETCPTELAPSSGFAAPAPQPVPAPAPAPAPVPEEPAPASPSNTFYANCDAVRAAGASPLYAGSPGYSR